jgi:arsenite methyltransferase
MSMTSASSDYFEKVAGQWDDLRIGYFSEEVRKAAFAKAYLHPEMTAADVGAGTGFVAAGLAPLIRKVHVVDGSPAMLEAARKNLAPFGNVQYHLADGQSLPFPDGSLDAAFANMYLHHCPDPLAAIREMVRILKPGGRLVITDADAHNHTWMREEMADVWLGFERDQVQAWLQEAGLVNVIVDRTGQSCCAEANKPALTDEKGRSASVSIFMATGTRRIPMRSQVQSAYSETAKSGCSCGSDPKAAAPQMEESRAASSCCSSQVESSCCSSSQPAAQEETSTGIYTPQELASAPADAGEFSLGCGNPIALANLRPGEVVLDIGSGGGLDSFLAAGKVGPSGRVIGVDMTPAMLERARRSAEKAGIHNVEFRQGQAEALPVESGTVDAILSNCVINLTEDKGLVFREAYRVLRPGGRLEVSDIVTDRALPLEARLDAGSWAGCVSGALPEQEYLDLIAQAGFTNVTVRRSTQAGSEAGINFYSASVSARKEGSSSPGASQAANQSAAFAPRATCCGG